MLIILNVLNGVLNGVHLARVTKVDKDFSKTLDFKDMISFLVKIRDIHKIENKNSMGISVFGYKNKKNYSIYVSK